MLTECFFGMFPAHLAFVKRHYTLYMNNCDLHKLEHRAAELADFDVAHV